ncbi:hypothetical protein DFJ74DRAFT_770900 [Hyaloraphidium curvatum]|nr:hypothetical protein DFJ74DRAFT_770900 [Hyaloraphidium curvatum]
MLCPCRRRGAGGYRPPPSLRPPFPTKRLIPVAAMRRSDSARALLALCAVLSLASTASGQISPAGADPAWAAAPRASTPKLWAAAPFCCAGCDPGAAGCCCGGRGRVTLTLTVRRTRTVSRVRSVTATKRTTVATVTTTAAVEQNATSLLRRNVHNAEESFVEIESGFSESESVDGDHVSPDQDPTLGGLEKRNLCQACPRGVAVAPRGSRAQAGAAYCCPARPTKTVTAPTRTVFRTQTRRVTTTLAVTATAVRRQFIQTVTGRLFIDDNANGRFDVGIDTPIANTGILLVQNTSTPLRLMERGMTTVMSNSTDAEGWFLFRGLFPEHAELSIVKASDPSVDFMNIKIGEDGRPEQTSLALAISSFNCTGGQAPGMRAKELAKNPAFVSKIRSAIIDLLASAQHVWKTGGNDTEHGKPGKLRPSSEIMRELGVGADPTGRCQFNNSGWLFALKGACGEQKIVDGLQATVIQIELAGNKTRCLFDGSPALAIDIGAYFHVFRPQVKVDVLEEGSAANNYHQSTRDGPAFAHSGTIDCSAHPGHERMSQAERTSLTDAANTLLIASYLQRGLNVTCGPLLKSVNATVKVLDACAKSVTSGSISGTEHLMRQLVAVPCSVGPASEWVALLQGNATTWAYYYDIYKQSKVNLTVPMAMDHLHPSTRSAPPLRRGLHRRYVVTSDAPSGNIASPQAFSSDSMSLPPSIPSRLLPRADSNAACLNGMCAYLLSDLDAAVSQFPILNINIKGIGNLLGFFSPSKFLAATARSICAMTFKGSTIAAAASASGALAWLSTVTVPVISDAASWFEMFLGLPVDPNTYYVLGFYTTQVPGVVYPPTMPNIQVAAAMNPCTGDFLFSFAGLEIEIPWTAPPLTLVVSLDAMGFSTGGKIWGSALGIVTDFWSPSGMQSVDINGQTYVQGSVSVDLGDVETEPVVISLTATGTVLINADPAKNGLAKTDVYLAIQVSAAPTLILLNGQLNFDLSAMASGNVAVVFQYLGPTNYLLALQAVFQADLAGVFSALPQVGEAISHAVEPMFGGYRLNGQFDVWVANNPTSKEWGVRICMGGTGMLGVLGEIWSLLTMFIPQIPSKVESCFSISGPTSGSGLPVKISLSALGKTMSMYFCKRDSQCPGGYQCTSGICATIACPSAHPNQQGLLCYDGCRSGYSNVLGVCWENCRDGFVDAGASCVQRAGACPSGTENQGGLCYPTCRDGYAGVLGVCWERCPDGYTDMGATCFRPAKTRGKGCCCHAELKCRKWKCSWKKACCDECDDGWSDTGCTCFRGADTIFKRTYTRNPTTALYFKNTYTIPAYPMNVKIAGLVW